MVFVVPRPVERLTEGRYADMIQEWKNTHKTKRAEQAAICKAEGHDWAETPFSQAPLLTYVCKRCLRYDPRGRTT